METLAERLIAKAVLARKSMTLGDRIYHARCEKNLNQSDLAKLCHLPKMHISRYERGQVKPNADSICRLCDALNVSADYLLGRTGE